MKKSIKLMIISLLLVLCMASSINVFAAELRSERVYKTSWTKVYTIGNRAGYYKLDPHGPWLYGNPPIDVRMKNSSGKVVWSENNAITSKNNYRVFYCGSNVYTIEARLNSSYSFGYAEVSLYNSTASQEGAH